MTIVFGRVSDRIELTARIRVRGPSAASMEIDAIIDSGFTGGLTLPDAVIQMLGLRFQSGGIAILADGSPRPINTYVAEIEWVDGWRGVYVSAVGNQPLIGLNLLHRTRLEADIVTGGLVVIRSVEPET